MYHVCMYLFDYVFVARVHVDCSENVTCHPVQRPQFFWGRMRKQHLISSYMHWRHAFKHFHTFVCCRACRRRFSVCPETCVPGPTRTCRRCIVIDNRVVLDIIDMLDRLDILDIPWKTLTSAIQKLKSSQFEINLAVLLQGFLKNNKLVGQFKITKLFKVNLNSVWLYFKQGMNSENLKQGNS